MSTTPTSVKINWSNQVNISSGKSQAQSLTVPVQIKCLTDVNYSVQLPYTSGTEFPSADLEGNYCAFTLSAQGATIPNLVLVCAEVGGFSIAEGTEGWFSEGGAFWYLGQGGIMIVGTIDIGGSHDQ
jgi:hypothetical protein